MYCLGEVWPPLSQVLQLVRGMDSLPSLVTRGLFLLPATVDGGKGNEGIIPLPTPPHERRVAGQALPCSPQHAGSAVLSM